MGEEAAGGRNASTVRLSSAVRHPFCPAPRPRPLREELTVGAVPDIVFAEDNVNSNAPVRTRESLEMLVILPVG